MELTPEHVCVVDESDDQRCQNWFLTVNNPTSEDLASVNKAHEMCKYVIACKEVGKECKTPHSHVLLVFKNAVRFGTLKDLFPRANIQKVRSLAHCVKYVKKDGDFQEWGVCPRLKNVDGSPLKEVAELVKKGASKRKIADAFPVEFMRYARGISELIAVRQPDLEDRRWYGPYPFGIPRDFEWDRSLVLEGPSGVNKSQFAKALFGHGRVLVVSQLDQLKSYDADLHDGIIFDDMRFYGRDLGIALTDVDENRYIKCRYEDALIPAGTRKVFTYNDWPFEEHAAIRRRCLHVRVQPYVCPRKVYDVGVSGYKSSEFMMVYRSEYDKNWTPVDLVPRPGGPSF